MIGALFLIGLLLASGLAATGGAPVPEHTTDAMGEAGAADARAADIAPGA